MKCGSVSELSYTFIIRNVVFTSHRLSLAQPSVEVHQVTITDNHMVVDWVYDSDESESVSVVVHYRKQGGKEVTYPPDAPASTLPASARQVRINGTFDVATPYSVWLTIYENLLLSHSTEAVQQMPSLAVFALVGAQSEKKLLRQTVILFA